MYLVIKIKSFLIKPDAKPLWESMKIGSGIFLIIAIIFGIIIGVVCTFSKERRWRLMLRPNFSTENVSKEMVGIRIPIFVIKTRMNSCVHCAVWRIRISWEPIIFLLCYCGMRFASKVTNSSLLSRFSFHLIFSTFLYFWEVTKNS